MSLIYYLTQIKIEFGAIRALAEECHRVGITRPLVVSDLGVRQAGVLQVALDALGSLPAVVYDRTPSNPTEPAVHEATALYKAHGCNGHDRQKRHDVNAVAVQCRWDEDQRRNDDEAKRFEKKRARHQTVRSSARPINPCGRNRMTAIRRNSGTAPRYCVEI